MAKSIVPKDYKRCAPAPIVWECAPVIGDHAVQLDALRVKNDQVRGRVFADGRDFDVRESGSLFDGLSLELSPARKLAAAIRGAA